MEENKFEFSWSDLEPYCILKWILRNIHMVILSTVLFYLAASICIMTLFPMEYQSRVTFVVASRSSYTSATQDASTANTTAATFTELLQSSLLREQVVSASGLPSFSGNIRATNTPGTNLITVSVTAPTAKQAFLVLESVIDNYDALTGPMFGDAVINILSSPNIIGYSTLPYSESKIKQLAVLAGSGAMIAFLIYQAICIDTIQTELGARKKLDAKVLMTIPHERRNRRQKDRPVLITQATVSFGFSEAIHRLRAKLEHQRQDTGGKIFMITSVAEHEGKSLLVENLGLSLALRHRSILVVDCDLRKPSRFNPHSKRHNAVSGKWVVEKEYTSGPYHLCLAHNTDTNLFALYSQKQMKNPSEFLTSGVFTSFLSQLENVFSFIIIDTPPLGLFSDAELLADLSDSSMLVIRQGVTPSPAANDAIDTLKGSKAQFMGCLLNDMQTLIPESIASYGYGYGSGGYGSSYRKSYGKYGKYGRYGKNSKYSKEADPPQSTTTSKKEDRR